MNDVLAARSQMAMSLAFHIIFAGADFDGPQVVRRAQGALARLLHPMVGKEGPS